MPPSILAFVSGSSRGWRAPGYVGAACIALLAGIAAIGPYLAPHDPFGIAGPALRAPTLAFPLGTDALGRDLLSEVLHGARSSFVVATGVSVLAGAFGSAIGLVAGYRGGVIDDGLMRLTEIAQVIPRFLLAIVSIAVLGPGLDRLIVVLAITSWPPLARLVRSEVILMRKLDFVSAAHALGASSVRIMRVQLLPNVAPTIVVATCLLFGQVLLLDAALGFLGLGDPARISWGQLAAQAQEYLRIAWWLAFFPGAAITTSVIGVNLMADAWLLRAQRSGASLPSRGASASIAMTAGEPAAASIGAPPPRSASARRGS